MSSTPLGRFGSPRAARAGSTCSAASAGRTASASTPSSSVRTRFAGYCPRPHRRRSSAQCGCPATATSTRTSRRTPCAAAARALGAEIRIRTLGHRDRVRDGVVIGVDTEHGRIETDIVVNAAGMWAPRVAELAGAFLCSVPVDHQHIALHAVDGPCSPARDAVFPRHRQSRLRQGGERRGALRRLRAEPGLPLGARRAVGARRTGVAAGPRPVPAADGRRRSPLSVPRGRGRGRPRLPPRRDDPGRQPAARAGAGRARALGRRRALAERLRGRGRSGQGARRARHRRGGRGRRPAVPAVALRRPVSRRRFRRSDCARGLQVLLPAPLPARRLAGGATEAPEPVARASRSARSGVRDEERLGARRVLPSG